MKSFNKYLRQIFTVFFVAKLNKNHKVNKIKINE